MKLLNKITDDTRQNFILSGEAGEVISFFLYFMPSQSSWFFDISWGTFAANGIRLCWSPNILRGFRNNITFGLSCLSTDGFDPKSIDDFVDGRIRLDLLSAADVALIESEIFS